ncbi:MAG: ABC transporter ATP-binding protein [Alphaproteobacteria bacterium]|nr:MAG: ABC transporter ATP-binding protein [Alphaproteobacteria bacterium]
MLEIEHLHVYYRKIHALKGLSLSVKQGEIVTLIGSNGAGKSTLLKSLFNNPRAERGHIRFMDRDITHVPTSDIASLGIAIVPEGRRIFPKMTVLENLDLGTTAIGGTHYEQDLEYVLTMFPRLRERLKQNGGTLSGGEQQMLAIARALMGRPRLLLLDEPSLGLAPIIIQQIFKTIEDLNKKGMTILLVEQNANQALRLAHRGYVMMSGAITLAGTGAELLANPSVRAAYLAG